MAGNRRTLEVQPTAGGNLKSFSFDGDTTINYGSCPNFSSTGGFSISAWVKDWNEAAGYLNGFLLLGGTNIGSDSNFGGLFVDIIGVVSYFSSQAVGTGKHHLYWRYDGSGSFSDPHMELYLDGSKLTLTPNVSEGPPNFSGDLIAGIAQSNYEGKLDQLAIWDTDKGAGSFLADLYNGGNGRIIADDEADLILLALYNNSMADETGTFTPTLDGNETYADPLVTDAAGGSSNVELRFLANPAKGEVPSNSVFHPGSGDNFTACIFFRSNRAPASKSLLFGCTPGASAPHWWLAAGSAQSFFYARGGSLQSFNNPADPYDNQWHSLALVRDGSTARALLDGVQLGTFTPGGGGNGSAVVFAEDPDPALQFIGALKQASYWSRALTNQEVADLHAAGGTLAGDETDLVAYWPLDDGEGDTFREVVDERDGTLTGDYRWSRGQTTSWEYDPLNRVSKETNPLGQTKEFEYDELDMENNLIRNTETNEDEDEIKRAYDALGRARRIEPEGEDPIVIEYDKLNRRTQMTESTGTVVWTYGDVLSRTVSVTTPQAPQPMVIVSDDEGRRKTLTDPDGNVLSYWYDPASKLTHLRDGDEETDPAWAALSYDGGNRLTEKLLRNGVKMKVDYDDNIVGNENQGMNRITDIKHFKTIAEEDDELLIHLQWPREEYDPLGNRLRMNRVKFPFVDGRFGDGSYVKYAYDKTSQLLSERMFLANDTEFLKQEIPPLGGYDDAGNRLQYNITDHGIEKQIQSAYDEANQLNARNVRFPSIPNQSWQTTYTNDLRGNRTQKVQPAGAGLEAEQWHYTFNIFNKLTKVEITKLGVMTEFGFKYGADGYRVEKFWGTVESPTDARKFIMDGVHVILEKDAEGETKVRYIPGVCMITRDYNNQPVIRYYHEDVLGSNVAMTDEDQNITALYQSDAWGNELLATEDVPNPYRWNGASGYYRDNDAQFYLLGMRWYDAQTGRFVSRDPMEIGRGQLNRLSYVTNQPTSSVDPLGLQDWPLRFPWREVRVPLESPIVIPRFEIELQRLVSDCPPVENQVDITRRDSVWCRDRKLTSALLHWWQNCYREIANGPGQQCCYNKKGELSHASPDLVSPAVGKDENGNCIWGAKQAVTHAIIEVAPSVLSFGLWGTFTQKVAGSSVPVLHITRDYWP